MKLKMLAVGAFLCATAAAAQAAPDWKAALLQDAQAFHDALLESHPGAVDAENPGFRAALAAGLAQAKQRAGAVDSYSGYRWALREYVAAFNDGHVSVSETAKAPKVPTAWPGFLTREQDGRQVVALRDDLPEAPPLGARLVSCDGTPAPRLLEQNVGAFRGRWNLESQHEANAWRLFIDAGNPFIGRPSRCVFEADGAERAYDLSWSPLAPEAFDANAKKVMATYRTGVELRPFGQRGLWISAGTFTSNAASEDGKKLEALVTALTQDKARLAAADVIVLDVRGNGGGSSRWGDRIAAALWGEVNAKAAKPSSSGVDWRASPANIRALEAFRAEAGSDLRMRVWADHAIGGMRRTQAAGQPLWRETSPLGGLFGGKDTARAAIDPAKANTRAPVFVLTDATCASACLDAMDVWKALGAVHVGRETSADSLYMENRDQPLPSGYGRLTAPMKVYRGRPRGSNQPYRPAHRLDVPMSDTPAVEAAILALIRARGANAAP